MRDFSAFLSRHDTLLLMFCAALFGMAWGLSHEHGLVPIPHWYTPGLHRFCLLLMGWTALLHADPLQRLFWTITDCVALSLPFLAGTAFVPDLDFPSLINYWVMLGKVASAATFGIAVTQAVYSLLPGWREAISRRCPSSTAQV